MARPRVARHVQPKDSFSGNLDGEMFVVNPREIFRDDHPIVLAYPDRFQPARESQPGHRHVEVEEMTAAPGERRGEPV